MLELRDIKKKFGATIALGGVDLELRPGEVHAVIGENGAGKSTLMNIIAGSIKPDAGSMRIDGKLYQPTSPIDARQSGVALIHQELLLYPHLTVAENILLGIEPSSYGFINREKFRQRAAKVLEAFDHPEIRPDRRVADLPLSARQIVEISRVIAANARIILMDEPTSSLSREDVSRLFALIRGLCAQNISVVYISHFLEEIREIADRYTVLRDGQSVTSDRVDAANDAEIIAQMVGRAVEEFFPKLPPAPNEASQTLLEVTDLSAPPVLKQASFAVKSGEIFGIAGLMGSGRSELVRALFGLEPARSGSIKTKSASFLAKNNRVKTSLQNKFGYLSEDRKGEGLSLGLSIADNATATNLAVVSRWGWINLARQRSLANELLRQLSVKAHDSLQTVKTLSGGNQQKIQLARLVHQEAEILLLDEPTRGIDLNSKTAVYREIARAAAEGKAVVLVSSYLPELFGMCHRIAVMTRGHLSEPRATEEWTPETIMQIAIEGETRAQ